MLNVLLDEGSVFDMLSIFEIKMSEAETPEKRGQAAACHQSLSSSLVEALSEKKFGEIMVSDEYKNLLAANRKTFDLVDAARRSKNSLANKVYLANHSRYLSKAALQKRFFNTDLAEIKTHE